MPGNETGTGAQGGAPGTTTNGPQGNAQPEPPKFVGSSTGGTGLAGAGATGATGAAGATGDEGTPGGRRVLESDLPEGALLQRLTATREAAAREARAAAFKELGIADPAEFKKTYEAQQAKLKLLEEEEEKRKREAMTREEQLAADLAKEKAAREAAEMRARELEESTVTAQQEVVVERVSRKYIDPEMYGYARADFIAHVNELAKTNPKALEEMDERAVDRFFRDLAKRKPKLAAEARDDKRPAVPTVRKPITSGPAPRQAPPPPVVKTRTPDVGAQGKTVRPGQPNSMTKQELRAHLASKGMKGW